MPDRRARLAAFAVVGALSAVVVPAARGVSGKTAVAVVNLHTNAAYEGQISRALARRPELQVLQRDPFPCAVDELARPFVYDDARTSPPHAADALLVVNDAADFTHVRLIRTGNGERLFDLAVPSASTSADLLAGDVQARCGQMDRRPEGGEDRRVRVAIMAFHGGGANIVDASGYEAIPALLASKLSSADNVVLLEREQLRALLEERNLGASKGASLSGAACVMGVRTSRIDSKNMRVEVVVRPVSGRELEPVVVEGLVADRVALVAQVVAGLLPLIATLDPASASRAAEAALDHAQGMSLLDHADFEAATRWLHVATLLEPTNTVWIGDFVKSVVQQMAKESRSPIAGIPPAQYLADLEWFRESLLTTLLLPRGATFGMLADNNMYRLLAAVPAGLSANALNRVSECRATYRQVVERDQLDATGAVPRGYKGFVAKYFPYMFDEPDDAIACVRALAAQPDFPWKSTWESQFLRVRYWDTEGAARAWSEFLDGVYKGGQTEQQFAVLASRCFSTWAFDQGSRRDSARPETKRAAAQLFQWIQADPEHQAWMIQHTDWYIFLRLWYALHQLEDADMEKAFGSVMMDVVHKDTNEVGNACSFLEREYGERGGATISDRNRAFLSGMLQTLARNLGDLDAASRKELAAKYSAADWFKALSKREGKPAQRLAMPPAAPASRTTATRTLQTPQAVSPGAKLVFDSEKIKAGMDARFDTFGGILDEQALWLTWPDKTGVRIARCGLLDHRTDVYHVNAEPLQCGGGCDAALMARVGRWLCIEGSKNFIVVPCQPSGQFLMPDKAYVLGPWLARGVNLGFSHEGGKRVSAVAGDDKVLYIAVFEDSGSSSEPPRYGGVLRWNAGSDTCTVICASDSLSPGPLNGCAPYRIPAACTGPDGSLYVFVAAHYSKAADAKPQPGLWKYTPKTGEWTLIKDVAVSAYRSGHASPRFVSDELFTFSAGDSTYFFNVADNSLRTLAGSVGDGDGVHSWSVKWSSDGQVRNQELLRLPANPGDKDTSFYFVNTREFSMMSVLPDGDRTYLLLRSPDPSGKNQNRRGWVYRLDSSP